MPFTDLHSHILPGYDDGASDVAEFLDMARAAAAGGTVRMAATPHYDPDSPGLDPEETAAAVSSHDALLRSAGIPLELVGGMEVRINPGLLRLAREGADLYRLTLGYGNKYLLCDLPLIDMPACTADTLFQLQLRGFVPILAHPERNRYLAARPDEIRAFAERGVELQVNSGSLEGLYGKAAMRCAFSLLAEGTARLLASDAHALNRRGPDLSGAARIVTHKFGADTARLLLEVNPERVLAGEPLLHTVAAEKGRSARRRRGLLSRWRRV